jgi:hypothetical protein
MPTMTKLLVFLLLTAFSISCSKDEFAPNKTTTTYTAPSTNTFTASSCTKFSVIKPKVDFLFIWDNSSSQLFINSQTKAALNNVIQSVSSNFDYRILSAPMFGTSGSPAIGNAGVFLVANDPSSLSGYAQGLLVPADQAGNRLSTFSNVGGGDEKGMERAVELLNLNSSNGIFRQNAYHIIVLMSNGNDAKILSNGYPDPAGTANHISTQENNLIYLKDNVLNSQQMRFMSIVAHSSCQSGYKTGSSYMTLSNRILTRGGGSSMEQSGRPYPDSYDICTSDFSNLFAGINSSITEQLVQHKYDHWLVASSAISAGSFDPNTITVTKSTGQVIPKKTGANANGWEYLLNAGTGNILTRNSRYQPTAGEPITGHIIRLYGTARITYPECLTVSTTTPTDYYDYVALDVAPQVSTIVLKINGATIPQSTSNGWEYVGYRASQNIKSVGTPVYRSGYFLKLHGSAVYSNGATVSVDFIP